MNDKPSNAASRGAYPPQTTTLVATNRSQALGHYWTVQAIAATSRGDLSHDQDCTLFLLMRVALSILPYKTLHQDASR